MGVYYAYILALVSLITYLVLPDRQETVILYLARSVYATLQITLVTIGT